jgi:hypothetical protein
MAYPDTDASSKPGAGPVPQGPYNVPATVPAPTKSNDWTGAKPTGGGTLK